MPPVRPSLPPTALVLLSIVSTQLGSAMAKSLFAQINPYAIVFLRVGFAAIVLLLLWRPRWQQVERKHYLALIGFGLVLALMNLSFYLAIELVPIGIAVALEFVGPLGLAVLNSRRWLDGLWVVLAAAGILLLAPVNGAVNGVTLDPMGLLLALTAGGFWAAYILLSAKVGKALPGGAGLAIAMTIGAVVLLPLGLWAGGVSLSPHLLLLGFGVALLLRLALFIRVGSVALDASPSIWSIAQLGTRCRSADGLLGAERNSIPASDMCNYAGHNCSSRSSFGAGMNSADLR